MFLRIGREYKGKSTTAKSLTWSSAMDDNCRTTSTGGRGDVATAVTILSSSPTTTTTLKHPRRYPNVRDYDTLRYLQFRYQFCEHDFVPLQWKAMQLAGWTYSTGSGIYKSPHGTRSFDHVNDMQQQFDMCSCCAQVGRPITTTTTNTLSQFNKNINKDNEPQESNRNSNRSNAVCSDATTATAAHGNTNMEQMNDLRNDIIYHMQILIENSADRSSNDKDDNDDVAHADPKQTPGTLNVVALRRTTRNSVPTTTSNNNNNSVSVTAIERGSDLYLHRTRKRATVASLTNKPHTTKRPVVNAIPHQPEDNILQQLPQLPTPDECSHFVSTLMNDDDDDDDDDDDNKNTGNNVCDRIEAQYQNHDFARWKFLLSTNHALLLYGNGSKYNVLSNFCRTTLRRHSSLSPSCPKNIDTTTDGDDDDGYCVQVNGYDSYVSMDRILDHLVSKFLHGIEPRWNDAMNYEQYGIATHQPQRKPPSVRASIHPPPVHRVSFYTATGANNSNHRTTIIDRAFNVARALAERCIVHGAHIYLIIHSLDGTLSTDIEQDALAALIFHSEVPGEYDPTVSSRAIRLVASIDHVDAIAALWSTETRNQFSWIYLDVPTYRPYGREMTLLTTLNEGGANTDRTKAAQRQIRLSSRASDQSERVLQVLKNLAPRYGEVMQILAELQLAEMENQQPRDNRNIKSQQNHVDAWVDYKAFFAACKSRFAIDKDSKLRTLQTELTDHHLMLSKSEGSKEYVRIPYPIDKLREIMSYQRNADH